MDEGIGPSIGQRLREIRVWRGLSLRAAAGLAGFSASYMSQIENGLSPVDKRSTLEAFATALRVAPSELAGVPMAGRVPDPEVSAAEATVTGIETVLSSVVSAMSRSDPALGLRSPTTCDVSTSDSARPPTTRGRARCSRD